MPGRLDVELRMSARAADLRRNLGAFRSLEEHRAGSPLDFDLEVPCAARVPPSSRSSTRTRGMIASEPHRMQRSGSGIVPPAGNTRRRQGAT
jgi:hypothetical protein